MIPASEVERGLAAIPSSTARALLGGLGLCVHGVMVIALAQLPETHLVDLVSWAPSLGASLLLVFFAPRETTGRAWNVVIGHTVAALAAWCVVAIFPQLPALVASALALPIACLTMLVTESLHAPAGITALTLVLTQAKLPLLTLLTPLWLGSLSLALSRFLLDRALDGWLEHRARKSTNPTRSQ